MSKRDAGSPLVVGHTPAGSRRSRQWSTNFHWSYTTTRWVDIVVRRYGRLCRRDELGRMGSEIQLQSASCSKEQMCLLGRLDEREALTTRCASTDHLIGARHRHLTMGTAGKNHHCVSFRDLQKKRSVVHYFRLLIGAYLVTVQTEVERLEYL